MKKITLEDCKNLQKKFKEYTKHAEQYEFIPLAMIDFRMEGTIKRIERFPDEIDTDQNNLNAMFRVVLKAIGEDYSEYKKEDE